MRSRLLTAAIALAASAGAVQAADLGAQRVAVPAAILAPAFNWSGFYAGVHAGAAIQRANFASDVISCFTLGCGTGAGHIGSDGAIATYGTGSNSRTGFIGGLQVGYVWQSGITVFGLEADLSGLTGNARQAGGTYPLTGGGTFTLANSAGINWMSTLRGRLGLTADRALFYVTGGLALANVKLGQSFSDNIGGSSTPLTTFSKSSVRAGFTVGAGVEYALGSNWTARAEYLYANLGRANGQYLATATTGNSDMHFASAQLQVHTLRVGLNYLFSSGPSAVMARY